MADFDLFNGDADGIFSLLQLRQIEPRPQAELVTGVKRNTELFKRIADRASAGDRVCALDIGMSRNTPALRRVLDAGAQVFFCDHHATGDIPQSEHLTFVTEDARGICTAYLIDQFSDGKKAGWAVCGAYGENFQDLAGRIAAERKITFPLNQLRELGELVNYNAYGSTVEDLHFHPSELYAILLAYPDPMAFLEDGPEALEILRAGYRSDWDIAGQAREIDISNAGQILSLPASPASNRIGGLFANALVDEDPDKAFAILTHLDPDIGGYRVSVRAPITRQTQPADVFAIAYGGGGRAESAGIDHLDESEMDNFISAFQTAFG